STKPAAADQSAPATPAAKPAGVDQYDVFGSNTSTTDLNPRLAAKGLTAEPSGSGVVVKPSLPLRDAVARSKVLATAACEGHVRALEGSGHRRLEGAGTACRQSDGGDHDPREREAAHPGGEQRCVALSRAGRRVS